MIIHSGILSLIHILHSLSDGKQAMKSLSITTASCQGKWLKISSSGISGWFSEIEQKGQVSSSSRSNNVNAVRSFARYFILSAVSLSYVFHRDVVSDKKGIVFFILVIENKIKIWRYYLHISGIRYIKYKAW